MHPVHRFHSNPQGAADRHADTSRQHAVQAGHGSPRRAATTDGVDGGFSPDSTELVEHWIGDQTRSRVVVVDDTTDVTLLDSQEGSSSVAVAFSPCGTVFGVVVDAPSASSTTVVNVYDGHGGGRLSSTTVGGYGATVTLQTTRSEHQALVGAGGTTSLVLLLPNSDGQELRRAGLPIGDDHLSHEAAVS